MLLPLLLGALRVQAPELHLPDGPAGRAWSARGPDVRAASIPPEIQSLARPSAWNERETWLRWSADLKIVQDRGPDVELARVRLALAALSQGRSEDAWEHFAALGQAPQWMDALVPYLVFGGPTREFADGALIAPSFPPLGGPARERTLGLGRLEQRELRWTGVKIGPAVVDVRIAMEYDGVQLEFEHKSGGTAQVAVVMPEPLDFELTSVYVDWEREPQAAGPHQVTLSAEVPLMSVYARCKPVQLLWPMTLPSELEARAREHGFEVLVAASEASSPRALGFADALQALTGVPARVSSEGDARESAAWHGVTLDFARGPERVRKFRTLLSQLERFALER